MRAILKNVHHYSATYPDQDIGVAEIREMHRKRGWRDVGYHYVIRRDGTIERGRPESKVGAHVAGHNATSIGICCIGGIERATGPNVGVDTARPVAHRD
ncbi:MAG: N-acetylmuramoyl-L-alanine amidase [Paracoccus sp. (in: a-proteobacteria)]|nr:N-acetylmuramoyl-L-alanine amidase [Paracoccus sp. (in: a-proteobacteria)]